MSDDLEACLCAISQVSRTLLGAGRDTVTGTVVFNPTAQDATGVHRPISLYFFIVSIGRREIYRLLDSMSPQLKPQDYTVVIFNDQDRHSVFDEVSAHCTCMMLTRPRASEQLSFSLLVPRR